MITANNKHQAIQVYDYSKVEEFYKILPGLFGTVDRFLFSDRIDEAIMIKVYTKTTSEDTTPEVYRLFINGEEYEVKKK